MRDARQNRTSQTITKDSCGEVTKSVHKQPKPEVKNPFFEGGLIRGSKPLCLCLDTLLEATAFQPATSLSPSKEGSL